MRPTLAACLRRWGSFLLLLSCSFWLATCLRAEPELTTAPSESSPALTLWWSKGFYPAEDQALERAVAAWSAQSQQTAELRFIDEDDLLQQANQALAAGTPPDILFSVKADFTNTPRWAWDNQLADLSEVIAPVADRYSPSALAAANFYNATTQSRAYYGVPIEQQTLHAHYWRDLLAEAGVSEAAIPTTWEAFWDFWVQVREQLAGDVGALGLTLSQPAVDTFFQFEQFLEAYDVAVLDGEGQLQVDQPAVRDGLVQVLTWLLDRYRTGAIPTAAVDWLDADNNASFLNRQVLMTLNPSLSIPGSQRADPEIYQEQMATMGLPQEPDGEPPNYLVGVKQAIVFAQAPHPEAARDFLRFLVQPETLGVYVKGSQGRWFPVMPELWADPFWNDPADPHVVAGVKQFRAGQTRPFYSVLNPAYAQVQAENVWGEALQRMIGEGETATQAAAWAIARIQAIFAAWS